MSIAFPPLDVPGEASGGIKRLSSDTVPESCHPRTEGLGLGFLAARREPSKRLLPSVVVSTASRSPIEFAGGSCCDARTRTGSFPAGSAIRTG